MVILQYCPRRVRGSRETTFSLRQVSCHVRMEVELEIWAVWWDGWKRRGWGLLRLTQAISNRVEFPQLLVGVIPPQQHLLTPFFLQQKHCPTLQNVDKHSFRASPASTPRLAAIKPTIERKQRTQLRIPRHHGARIQIPPLRHQLPYRIVPPTKAPRQLRSRQ